MDSALKPYRAICACPKRVSTLERPPLATLQAVTPRPVHFSTAIPVSRCVRKDFAVHEEQRLHNIHQERVLSSIVSPASSYVFARSDPPLLHAPCAAQEAKKASV